MAVANCTAETATGSARPAKWSQQRMCALNPTAHRHTSVSPRVSRKPSVTHRRYVPATPSATANQTGGVPLSRKKTRRITGTSSIYMAVIKPALPAVVVTSPACCRILPAVRHTPQHTPPMRAERSRARRSSAGSDAAPRLRTRASAPTATAARAMRAAVKLMGSIRALPTRWLTKAVPHMKAVRSRSRFPSIFLFFITGPSGASISSLLRTGSFVFCDYRGRGSRCQRRVCRSALKSGFPALSEQLNGPAVF